MRSTPKVIGTSMSPGRRKYPCIEWIARSSMVDCAATMHCARTWPPNTRPPGDQWLAPVRIVSPVLAPVSESRRVWRKSGSPFTPAVYEPASR